MRNTVIASAVLAALTVSTAAVAQEPAKEDPGYTLTGNVTLASEYIYRGIAQTNRKPAVQGGFDFGHNSGFYLGVWGSNISWLSDLGGISAPVELDIYGGYKGSAGDISYDFGLLQYYYPGTYPDGFTSPNTLEGYASAGYKWVSVKASYSFTNLFGWLQPADGSKTSGSYYLEANGAFELGAGFNLAAHLGYQSVKGFDDASYTDWKLGVTKEIVGLNWGLAYVGTNAKGEPGEPYRNAFDKDMGAARIVLSVGKSL